MQDKEHVRGIEDRSVPVASTDEETDGASRRELLLRGGVGAAALTGFAAVAGRAAAATDGAGRSIGQPSVVTKTSDYTISVTDDYVLVNASSGNVTITMPSLVKGEYTVKRLSTNTNTVTILRNGTALIDGSLTFVLDQPYESVTLVGDSTNWSIV